MPTYEYSCDTCEHHFEWVQSFSEDTLTKCPGKRKGGPATEACVSPGKGKVNKVFSAVGISFKGDGFYKNDHGANAKSKTASESSSSSITSTDKDSSSSTASDSTSSDNAKSDTSSTKAEGTTKTDKKSDAKKADTKKAADKKK